MSDQLNDSVKYIHGHHESVLRSHIWRTIENSCAYFKELLKPDMTLLDIGCGPGTITCDLAEKVYPGAVIGIDDADEAVSEAIKEAKSRKLDNITILKENIYELHNSDISELRFDVVHIHQVLQHVSDPVRLLKIAWEYLTPRGFLVARESDYHGFVWYPENRWLTRWMEIYQQIARANKGEPDAGRYLLSWAYTAGIRNVQMSASVWCYADDQSRKWWGSLWADRAIASRFANEAIARGVSTHEELKSISEAFLEWSDCESGIFLIPSVEMICFNN